MEYLQYILIRIPLVNPKGNFISISVKYTRIRWLASGIRWKLQVFTEMTSGIRWLASGIRWLASRIRWKLHVSAEMTSVIRWLASVIRWPASVIRWLASRNRVS